MSEENGVRSDDLELENTPTTLQGNSLLFARIVWAVLVAVSVLTVIVGSPAYIKEIQDLIDNLGLANRSVGSEILLLRGPSLFLLLPLLIAGIVIFLALNDDWMGMLISSAFLMYVALTSGVPFAVAVENGGIMAWAMIVLAALTWTLGFAILVVFPDGTPVPRWAIVLIIAYLAYSIFWFVSTWMLGTTLSAPINWLGTGFLLIGIAAQVYRFSQSENTVRRQQIKWLLLGVTLAGLAAIGYELLRVPLMNIIHLSPEVQTDLDLTGALLSAIHYLVLAAAPVCITIAILEYRLERIDAVVGPSPVQYAITIVVMIMAFALTWFILQSVDQALSGQAQPPIAILGAVVVTAALFRPIRRQIGRLVYQGLFHMPA